MEGKELEERKATLADQLKAKAATMSKGALEEICLILVDTSTSMCESINRIGGRSKLEAVRLAIPNLRALNSRLMYGLIGFGDSAEIIQNLTMQFALILSQGERLTPNGTTNMTDGMRKGLGILGERFAEKKRMILLSDGHANIEEGQLDMMVTACIERVITVDTIAFGETADRKRLREIAIRTGGVFYEAGDELQLQQAYSKLNYNVRYLEHKK